jgi:NAD(P)-dependent dehydrogenase (short-subunit alcohol dehydrogenase family)
MVRDGREQHSVQRRGRRVDAAQASGTPQEVANVALFLASDESSFVTADRIVCAGGKYM